MSSWLTHGSWQALSCTGYHAGNHSSYELMFVMALLCLEDSIRQPFSPSSGSYTLSASFLFHGTPWNLEGMVG